MTSIQKVRSISIWIFIIPLFSVNICLYTITHIHSILEPGIPINPTFPYLDGGNPLMDNGGILIIQEKRK